MVDQKALPCPDCKGHGYITGCSDFGTWSRTCDRCNGTGTIIVPKTRGDQIRAMSDEELAGFILDLNFCGIFCTNKKECQELMASDKDIPDEWCKKCFLLYLQEPADDLRPRPIFEDKQESGLLEE